MKPDNKEASSNETSSAMERKQFIGYVFHYSLV